MTNIQSETGLTKTQAQDFLVSCGDIEPEQYSETVLIEQVQQIIRQEPDLLTGWLSYHGCKGVLDKQAGKFFPAIQTESHFALLRQAISSNARFSPV